MTEKLRELARTASWGACVDLCKEGIALGHDVSDEEWITFREVMGISIVQMGPEVSPSDTDAAINAIQEVMPASLPEEAEIRRGRLSRTLGFLYAKRTNGDKRANLNRAAASYESAMETLTRDQFPQDWAELKVGVGMALMSRVRELSAEEIRSRPELLNLERENLRRATQCYEEALLVYNEDEERMAEVVELIDVADNLLDVLERRERSLQ